VLSNRADLLSAGDVLVRIERRVKVRASRIRVTAGRRDVSRAFRLRRNGCATASEMRRARGVAGPGQPG
jgi:hypothetical protein